MILFKIIKIINILLRDKDSFFNQKFIFKSKMKRVYSHFVNINFNFINIRNNFAYSFLIFHHQKINIIIKYETQKNY